MSISDEMRCKELVEVITDYLEGSMAASDRERFEAHLRECPYCVNYLEQMRTTIDALGEVEPESIAPSLRTRLLDAFRDWQRTA